MNNAPHEENRRASDMTTADYVSLTVAVLAILTSCIGFATDSLKLVGLALIVALPATVVKVRLTQARSQAAYREEQVTGRDRRVPNDVRRAETAAMS